ncbi:MAG TPA: hypothetical protein VN132_14330, partial [Bdellovibrio sp.]|nr:hypothetical protein [Bdellovibrio sp.]
SVPDHKTVRPGYAWQCVTVMNDAKSSVKRTQGLQFLLYDNKIINQEGTWTPLSQGLYIPTKAKDTTFLSVAKVNSAGDRMIVELSYIYFGTFARFVGIPQLDPVGLSKIERSQILPGVLGKISVLAYFDCK